MATIDALGGDQIDAAAITLARAFSDDPMFAWMFPDAAAREAALVRFNRVPVEYGVRYGRVTASHEARAVAVWIPPGHGITVPGMLRAGLLGVPFTVGFAPFIKFMRANGTMERIHKDAVPEPHWYLMVVGVDPALQGRGAGSALVREGLALADQGGHACYLETSHDRNLDFYQRLGFTVLETATLGPGGPPAWAMRREPVPR